MLKLTGYEPGANITILNALYRRQEKLPNGKWSKDYVFITFKDNDTGEKKIEIIEEPEYTFYVAKPGVEINNNLAFIDRQYVEPVTCKYNSLLKAMATAVGELDLYNNNIRARNFNANKVLFTHPRLFGCDLPIENFIRMEFNDTYKNPVCPINIAYYDIETDLKDSISDEPGDNPIIAISLFNQSNDTVYSFLLRNPNNPLIDKFENELKTNSLEYYKKKVFDKILLAFGDEETIKKYKLDKLKITVGFFDTEQSMISTFFGVLKDLDPDFAIAYNAAFDLPNLAKRLYNIGLDPVKVICDNDVPDEFKFFYYFIDEKNRLQFEERCDYAAVASRITYIDQLIIYASRRKGRAALESYKLDYIGSLECGVHKLNYADITLDIGKLPYLNYEIFCIYNIIDTLVQACIERQTDDVKYMFNNVVSMHTPYAKIFRQTQYLFTKGFEFYKNDQGLIMGNNINKFGKKPEDKFPGAFVADPNKVSDKNKAANIDIYKICKYYNGNDFDYKSLYPSLAQEFNMAANTQIGMIRINNAPYNDPEYLRLGSGGSFTENLGSYNFIEFCHRWLSLGDVTETMRDIKEYYTIYRTPIYKGIDGDKEYDKKHKFVVYRVNQNRPLRVNRPMPQWVKDRVNMIRERISIL